MNWLNSWEANITNGHILPEEFLTQSTAEGLRVTITSTIELTKYLLDECNFSYVLTAKMNQDNLEVNIYILPIFVYCILLNLPKYFY